VGEHRIFLGFLNSNLTRLKLKIMSIRLFRYEDTQMTIWSMFPRLITKTEEKPFWRLWPVRPLECNVPKNCERSLECALDWCDVYVLLSHQQAVAAAVFGHYKHGCDIPPFLFTSFIPL
jgi:hypothetical protein